MTVNQLLMERVDNGNESRLRKPDQLNEFNQDRDVIFKYDTKS